MLEGIVLSCMSNEIDRSIVRRNARRVRSAIKYYLIKRCQLVNETFYIDLIDAGFVIPRGEHEASIKISERIKFKQNKI